MKINTPHLFEKIKTTYKNLRKMSNNPVPEKHENSVEAKKTIPLKDHVHILKLICVGFKESPLDSPSFRASVNYFNQQLETIEHWIEQVIKTKKFKAKDQFEEFQKFQNQLCEILLPPVNFLNSGVLDGTECTPEVLTRFHTTLKQVMEKVFSILKGNPEEYSAQVQLLLEKVVKPYKEVRKNFEYYQVKYDSFLDKYQSAKYHGVDPSTMREDAFQLFEVRKKYLQYSLELVLQIAGTNNRLSEHLVDLLCSLKSENEVFTDDLGSTVVIFTDVLSNFTAAKHWFHTSIAAHKSLIQDIYRARDQVEKSYIAEITPSRNIDHYNLHTVIEKLEEAKKLVKEQVADESSETLLAQGKKQRSAQPISTSGQNFSLHEKSGWLYMKTTIGVPGRTVWVRRWCFIKNSVFGMLALAPGKNFVQETDKFGVLLTKLKYNHKEDRKFCFELQISGSKDDINIVLQADSYIEMEEWFKCVSYVKEKLVSKNISKDEYELAFLRFPPLYTEYACSSSTSIDNLITTSENCVSLVEKCGAKWTPYGEIIFQEEGMFKTPTIAAPMMTKLTKLSILANNFAPTCDIPNAVTANLWGSVNWCNFFLEDRHVEKLKTSTKYIEQLNGNLRVFPSFYPAKLQNDDLQLKALFPMSEGLLIMRLDCALSPNDQQDFQGTCFFTAHDVFFYMNSTGFLSLVTVSISDLASFEIIDDKYISMYKTNELVMKIKVAPDVDLKAVVSKLNYLIENLALKDKPDDEKTLIQKFQKMDRDLDELQKKQTKMLVFHDEKLEYVKKASEVNPGNALQPLQKNQPTPAEKFGIVNLNIAEADITRRREKLAQSSLYVSKIDVPIEPQALMHLMFGENSVCFPKMFRFYNQNASDKSSTSVKPWVYYKENNAYMREFHLQLIYPNSFISKDQEEFSKNVIVQKINKIQSDYCEVETDHGDFYVPFVGTFRVKLFYVISRSPRVSGAAARSAEPSTIYRRSVLEAYMVIDNMDTGRGFWRDFLQHFMEKKVEEEIRVMKQIAHHYYTKMGNHGQLIKSVRIGGKISSRDTQREVAKWVDNRPMIQVHLWVLLRIISFRYLTSFVLFVIVGLKKVLTFFAALLTNITLLNKLVLTLLLLSGLGNLFLLGKSTISYWRVHKASQLANYHKNGGLVMERALYLNDLDLLTQEIVSPNKKDYVYEKFISTKEYETKYKDIRYEIAKRRNDLLVELKILSSMESEVMKGDFAQFVTNELQQCETVRLKYPDVWNDSNSTTLRKYCENCELKINKLEHNLL